jgi:hypothetical protein
MIECLNSAGIGFPLAFKLVAKCAIHTVKAVFTALDAFPLINVSEARYSLIFAICDTSLFIQKETFGRRAGGALNGRALAGLAFTIVARLAIQSVINEISYAIEA